MRLSGVSETLLVPLCARYAETLRSDGIIKDPKAVEIVAKIGCDVHKYAYSPGQVGTAIRTEIIDREVRAFTRGNRRAAIVNLGAGLCTRFYRVDDGELVWFEVDLPQVAAVWRQLFSDEPRHFRHAYSVLDDAWMDEIAPRIAGRSVLFIAEGLLMYFTEEQVRAFVNRLRDRFPGSELILEAMNPLLATNTLWNAAIARTSAKFAWGIRTVRRMEDWAPGIVCLGEWDYLDYHRDRWGWFRYLRRIPFVEHLMVVGRLRLGAAAPTGESALPA
jgi:O-methyltransferase involved in polyketide biosynthesis